MNFHSKFVVCLILFCLSGSATASERPDLYELGVWLCSLFSP